MLNSQAPYVEVITDCNDDIDDERAIDTDGAAQHEEHVRDLVDTVAKGAGPAKPRVPGLVLQQGAERVDDTVCQWEDEDIGIRIFKLDQMCCDDLTYGIGVDQAAEEGEGDQMVVQDVGLQEQVGADQRPGDEEGRQADKSVTATVAARTAGLDHVPA